MQAPRHCRHGSRTNPRADQEVETADIDGQASDDISRTIIFYANQTLRIIALCCRDFNSWSPLPLRRLERMRYVGLDNESLRLLMWVILQVAYDNLAMDLTLIAIPGIEDPLHQGPVRISGHDHAHLPLP